MMYACLPASNHDKLRSCIELFVIPVAKFAIGDGARLNRRLANGPYLMKVGVFFMYESYCMRCFPIMPRVASVCPACRKAVITLTKRSYREKLLAALRYLLAEVRMRAVIALSLQHDASAASNLAACALRHPADLIERLGSSKAYEYFREASRSFRRHKSCVKSIPRMPSVLPLWPRPPKRRLNGTRIDFASEPR